MLLLAVTALLSVANAQPWYSGACGISQYADAGAGCPIGGTCTNIVGGKAARENEFPWTVSVQDATGHQCAGVILNERWVLSAATCTSGFAPGEIQLVVGEHSLSTSSPNQATYDTEAVFENEIYDPSTFNNDITLVKTTANITFNAAVTPICPPDPANQYAGVDATTCGWGGVATGAPYEDVLRFVTLRTIDNTACQAAFTGNTITANMICAGDGGANDSRDTCQGDAGGALATKDATTGEFTVIGLTSWGIGCAAGYPGVYTRVAQFNNWITDKINKN